jgi:hypothetical protein
MRAASLAIVDWDGAMVILVVCRMFRTLGQH